MLCPITTAAESLEVGVERFRELCAEHNIALRKNNHGIEAINSADVLYLASCQLAQETEQRSADVALAVGERLDREAFVPVVVESHTLRRVVFGYLSGGPEITTPRVVLRNARQLMVPDNTRPGLTALAVYGPGDYLSSVLAPAPYLSLPSDGLLVAACTDEARTVWDGGPQEAGEMLEGVALRRSMRAAACNEAVAAALVEERDVLRKECGVLKTELESLRAQLNTMRAEIVAECENEAQRRRDDETDKEALYWQARADYFRGGPRPGEGSEPAEDAPKVAARVLTQGVYDDAPTGRPRLPIREIVFNRKLSRVEVVEEGREAYRDGRGSFPSGVTWDVPLDFTCTAGLWAQGWIEEANRAGDSEAVVKATTLRAWYLRDAQERVDPAEMPAGHDDKPVPGPYTLRPSQEGDFCARGYGPQEDYPGAPGEGSSHG